MTTIFDTKSGELFLVIGECNQTIALFPSEDDLDLMTNRTLVEITPTVKDALDHLMLVMRLSIIQQPEPEYV